MMGAVHSLIDIPDAKHTVTHTYTHTSSDKSVRQTWGQGGRKWGGADVKVI